MMKILKVEFQSYPTLKLHDYVRVVGTLPTESHLTFKTTQRSYPHFNEAAAKLQAI